MSEYYIENWPTSEFRIVAHPSYPYHERFSVENWVSQYYNGEGDDMTPVGAEWSHCGYFRSEQAAISYVFDIDKEATLSS